MSCNCTWRAKPVKLMMSLRWRHDGRDGVSNHQPHDCLHNRVFRRRSKEISKLHDTALCEGNSPKTSEFSAQKANIAENVSIWWRHHLKAFHLECTYAWQCKKSSEMFDYQALLSLYVMRYRCFGYGKFLGRYLFWWIYLCSRCSDEVPFKDLTLEVLQDVWGSRGHFGWRH